MSEWTPTPWETWALAGDGLAGARFAITREDDTNHGPSTLIAAAIREEDAARIIRCINAHDALVAALKTIEPIWAQVLADRYKTTPAEMREPVLNMIHAALAKALGQ